MAVGLAFVVNGANKQVYNNLGQGDLVSSLFHATQGVNLYNPGPPQFSPCLAQRLYLESQSFR